VTSDVDKYFDGSLMETLTATVQSQQEQLKEYAALMTSSDTVISRLEKERDEALMLADAKSRALIDAEALIEDLRAKLEGSKNQ
jgi:ABC-type transporter Mla subunit MlaD